jgi:inner membrane protein
LLLLGIVRLLGAFRIGYQFKTEWRSISFLAFLGPLTHIGLDSLNNYGVHPFWPLDSSWKYADWVFVLEPWFWVTFSFFLFSVASTKKGKRFYAAIPILGAFLSVSLGVVPLFMNGVLLVWALFLAGLNWKFTDKTRVFVLWSAVALILMGFEIGQRQTKALIVSQLNSQPGYQLEDLSLSPLPLNPFCWAVVSIESDTNEYRMKRAITAPFPKLVSLSTCTQLRFFAPEIQITQAEDHTLWETEHIISIRELESLWREYCDVRDFLQFARAPFFWIENDELFFSDLRFERKGRNSFARVKIRDLSPPCKPSKAPWLSPLKRFQSLDASSDSF